MLPALSFHCKRQLRTGQQPKRQIYCWLVMTKLFSWKAREQRNQRSCQRLGCTGAYPRMSEDDCGSRCPIPYRMVVYAPASGILRDKGEKFELGLIATRPDSTFPQEFAKNGAPTQEVLWNRN